MYIIWHHAYSHQTPIKDRTKYSTCFHFFLLLVVFAVDEEVVVFLPPLSSLFVEEVEVVFAELTEVTRVLPGVLLAPEVVGATVAEDAIEDPEPEEAEALTEAEPPPPFDEVTVCSVVCDDCLVFQYSSSFSSTSLTFLYASISWKSLHFFSIAS